MTVIKFDPNRRKKKQSENKKVSYRITDKYRIKLALAFALCAAFFQMLVYYPKILLKLPLAFVVLTVIALSLEGLQYLKFTKQQVKKAETIPFKH